MKRRKQVLDELLVAASDDEWIQPDPNGFHIACCDCGLVHRLRFRLVDKGRVLQMNAKRERRLTTQLRRKTGKGPKNAKAR